MVVFGRPGAGKTTISDIAVRLLSKQESLHCVGLDLDVCVPQWMRDNFDRGVYPTLDERRNFALGACDYVDTKLKEQAESLQMDPDIIMTAIVSFSFVNADLRDIYRTRFPRAVWALLDTTENEAADRIRKREGHFFKGSLYTENKTKSPQDSSVWDFAPVTFPHMVLAGSNAIEHNSQKVADLILKEVSGR